MSHLSMMMSSLFLLNFVGLAFVSGLKPPTYTWLFNADRGADEVQTNTPPDSPENSALLFGTGPYGENGRSVVFDDYSYFYIKSSLTETEKFDRFSLCMFVYPDSFPGIFLEYEAASREDNSVYTFKLSVQTDGAMEIEMSYSGGRSVSFQTSPYKILTGIWNFVCLIRDDDVTVMIGDEIVANAPTTSISDVRDLLPGTFKFGETFTGRMTCVTYYDKAVTADDKSDVVQDCQLTDSASPTASVTCTHVWPLNNSTFGFELKNAQSPKLPLNSACMRIGESYSSLPHGSTYFDGGVTSFLETTLPLITLQRDFSIAFLLKPFSPMTGTLLHFLYNNPEKGIRELKLTGDKGTLTLSLSYSRELTSCGTVSHTEELSAKVWYYIGIQRNGNQLTLKVANLDSPSFILNTGTDTCDVEEPAGVEVGYFRIGDDVEGGRSYRGLFSCLAVFAGITDDTDATLTSQCSALDVSDMFPFDFDSCPERQPVRDNYLRKYRDVLPIATEIPMTSQVVSSVRACARVCLTGTNCRSMSVQKLSSVTYLCQTYDFVTSGVGLVHQTETNYYVISL